MSRSKKQWQLAAWALGVVVVVVVAATRLGLLNPSFDRGVEAVLVARFEFGRWPRGRSEVLEAGRAFMHLPGGSGYSEIYDEIVITPLSSDRARVLFRGHNLIGVPYEVERLVAYTPDKHRELLKSAEMYERLGRDMKSDRSARP